jgi:hypothetical protein
MAPRKFTPYERTALHRAYEHLTALDPVTAVRIPMPMEAGNLSIAAAGPRMHYVFSVRRSLFPKTMPHFLHQLQKRSISKEARHLLITDYLTDAGLNLVRSTRNVDYVDEAGNMLLRWPHLHIEIRGRRRVASSSGRGHPLSTAGGARVLFALLAPRSLHGVVYRDLEVLGGVTLGTISQTINRLRLRTLIERRSNTLVRLRPADLLELWVTGYAQRLRPQLVVGRYRSGQSLGAVVEQVQRDLPREEWALTGGFAAEALTKHFRGDSLELFMRAWEPDRMKRWRWLPDEHGPITIFRPFSDGMFIERMLVDGRPVIHPLLVYAELIVDGRERAHETAERVREQYLGYLTDDVSR